MIKSYNKIPLAKSPIHVASGRSLTTQTTKDCFINSNVPDLSYDFGNLQVYNGGAADSLYALVYFDLSTLIGKTIISAKFYIYAENIAAGTIIGVQRITGPWTAATCTYNTRPAIDATVYWEDTLPANVGWKEIDLKTLVQGVANGDTYTGIWLYVGNPVLDFRWIQFSASEGTNPEYLLIKYK